MGKTKYPLKFGGSMNLVAGSEHDSLDIVVERALLRTKDELALSFHDLEELYDVLLKRTGKSHFEGSFSGPDGKLIVASCNLYSSEDGYFLFGKWTQATYDYWWWCDLHQVIAFLDERDE